MNKRIKTALLTSLAITAQFMAGCASSLPETKMYSLSTAPSLQESPMHRGLAELRIGVGPITFPDMLKRPQIVSRLSNNKLHLSEEHHWAGYLEKDFLTTLTQNLTGQLGTAGVTAYPWDNRRRLDYQVQLHVFRFDGILGRSSSLIANWSLVSGNGRKELEKRSEKIVVAHNDDTYEAMVAAQSTALGMLSEKIAVTIIDSTRSDSQETKN